MTLSALALIGALYGSIRALRQIEVPRLLAYASLAFYSIVWWTFGATGSFSPPIAVFVVAAALLTAALLLAWQRQP